MSLGISVVESRRLELTAPPMHAEVTVEGGVLFPSGARGEGEGLEGALVAAAVAKK